MANILILEDNLELALYWQSLLEKHQHHIRCSANVEHALKLVEQQLPDLVITDMLIRDNNNQLTEGGLTFISRLNLNTAFTGPILGISIFKKGPYAHTTPLEAAKQLGIAMALYKPISEEQLIAAVSELLPESTTTSPSTTHSQR